MQFGKYVYIFVSYLETNRIINQCIIFGNWEINNKLLFPKYVDAKIIRKRKKFRIYKMNSKANYQIEFENGFDNILRIDEVM